MIAAEEKIAPAAPKKLRQAELLQPPNRLKEKVGSGGIDPIVLSKAQEVLDSNPTDFAPIGESLLKALFEAVNEVRSEKAVGEVAIESILYPVMQLKAKGAMFRYPLITEVSSILVDFLETVSAIDNDILEIALALHKVLKAILTQKMEGNSTTGKIFCQALNDACERYQKQKMS